MNYCDLPNMAEEREFEKLLDEKAKEGPEALSKFMAWQGYRQEKMCHSMNEHMAQINGSVAKTKLEIEEGRLERESIRRDVESKSTTAEEKFETLRKNQEELPDRMWTQLPNKWKFGFILIIILMIINAVFEGIGIDRFT